MKRFTSLFTIIMMILFFSVPVMAANDKIQGAIGDGNVGIQANGAVKDNIINTGDTTVNRSGVLSGNTNSNLSIATKGGKIYNTDVDVDIKVKDNNTQLGTQSGKNNTAVNGSKNVTVDNSVDKSKTFVKVDIDKSKTDSHDRNGDYRNIDGDVATKGGTIVTKGSTLMQGKNVLSPHHNHSGNSHNSGAISTVGKHSQNNNSGIIFQGNNIKGGKKGGGYGGYDNGPSEEGAGDVNINNSVDNSTFVEDKREFAPAHTPVIASFADYVGSETPGYVYQTIEEMLTFGKVFTESQLKSMAGKRGLRGAVVDVTMMDSNMACQKPTLHPVAGEKTVTVYYKTAVPNPIRRGAFITVAMKSVKGISVETLGKSCLAVLEVGGNSLFLTAQGMDITQSQHSIAVGPGVTFSSVGGSGDKGVTGGGGLTYSYGVFGKNYKPYLRGMALYVEDADHKYVPRSKLKDDKK